MDLTQVNELTRDDLNCNIFSVYDYDGLSMQELLSQFFTKINEVVKGLNDTNTNVDKQIKDFKDIINWLKEEGLKIEVAEKLLTWLNDGTLETIINETVFEDLNTKVNEKMYVYTSFTQLGIPVTSTPKEIADAMKNNSMALLNITITNTGFYNNPYDYGTFIAHKVDNARVVMEFISLTENRRYTSIRRKDDTNDYFSGWSEISPLSIVDRPLNSDDCIEEMIAVAETYLIPNYWRYSTVTPFRSDSFVENGKRNIDCSTFVQLALLGINFQDSPYFSSAFSTKVRKEYRWPYNFDKKESFYSYRMAEKFYKNGWEIKPFADYSNLQRGDLVFWRRENPGREHMIGFRNVDHVAIYYGLVDGVHKVIEVWVDDDIARIGNLQDARESRICMFARVPLNNRKNRLQGTTPKYFAKGDDIKLIKLKNITSSNLNINATTQNLCDYDKVEIGSLSTTTGADTVATNRLRTGFIPCAESFGVFNNNTPSGFTLTFICYYDKHKNFLGIDSSNTNKFYMRRVYNYNTSDITETLRNAFRDSFMINFGGVLRRYEKGRSIDLNITLDKSFGDLTFNGVEYLEVGKTVSDDIVNKIKTLKTAGMTHIYTNQLNEIVVEV